MILASCFNINPTILALSVTFFTYSCDVDAHNQSQQTDAVVNKDVTLNQSIEHFSVLYGANN